MTDPAGGFDRTANVVGALVLAVSDRMLAAVADAADQPGRPGSESAATVLSALHHFLDAPTIGRIRTVLGLTSSGAVRLVDRLEAGGLVERRSATDGRETVVALTAAGRRAAAGVARARAGVLEEVLGPLDAAERAALEPLVSRIVVGLIREPGSTRWMCRLCDTGRLRAEDA